MLTETAHIFPLAKFFTSHGIAIVSCLSIRLSVTFLCILAAT